MGTGLPGGSSFKTPCDALCGTQIAHHLGVLKAATPDLQGNKASVQQSLSALAEVAKAGGWCWEWTTNFLCQWVSHHTRTITEDRVDDIIALGGIEVVVPLLSACAVQLDAAQRCVVVCTTTSHQWTPRTHNTTKHRQDLERDGCLILSLSATKNEYQRYIAQQRALPEIVSLLRRYAPVTGQRQVNGYATRRAADVITNLAHENVEIKEEVCGVELLCVLMRKLPSSSFSLQHTPTTTTTGA